ncbi:MAG: peptidylprolyl isomerase [Acidobacteria bacterium]|nr:peptidylprolyl isomerase [Acidobacteriota bacterium]
MTFLVAAFSAGARAQVPLETGIRILHAEDARSFNRDLTGPLHSPNAAVRARAALAAGRIGSPSALPHLIGLLKSEKDVNVRATVAFALGEIESQEAANAVLAAIASEHSAKVRARLIEAAGKIAAAEPKGPSAAELKKVIVLKLEVESAKQEKRDKLTVLLGLTALIRTRAEGADVLAAKFLSDKDARVRADAANALTRLRAKNAADALIRLVKTERDPVARANAARAIGASGDKAAAAMLAELAAKDSDSRVRISAVRSLASLKDAAAGKKLIERANALLKQAIDKGLVSRRIGRPDELTELLELASALGRIFDGTGSKDALEFLRGLGEFDHHRSSETETAFAHIAPAAYAEKEPSAEALAEFWAASAYSQGLAAVADSKNEAAIAAARKALSGFYEQLKAKAGEPGQKDLAKALPDAVGAMFALKVEGLEAKLLEHLEDPDVFMRVAAAGGLAEMTKSDKIVKALEVAFGAALSSDKHEDDAQLAILDALAKLDKQAAVPTFALALSSPDYLVRKKAFDILGDKSLKKDEKLETLLKNAREKRLDEVRPYSASTGTKLGQILNKRDDYIRALSRKNGSATAILTTEKGVFEIELFGEDAPLTVDNFIKLANSGYFNGLAVHRVVANFVMQDGDPRGDGNGGPGWSIRCEINMQPYDRGAVGMALSGKDTGGSQWFVTHSPQPHLDGGYTVFGRVKGTGMDVVDSIVRGDKILTVKIVEK